MSKSMSTPIVKFFRAIMILGCMYIAGTSGCATYSGAPLDSPPDALNCRISVPPMDAGYNYVHGTYLFIYPRVVPDNYSGCQIMWGQDGKKWIILYMEEGHPKRQWVDYPSKTESAKYVCVYENDSLVNTDNQFCDAFQREEPFGGLVLESIDIDSDPAAKKKLQELQ